jgi:rhamnose utilization protein RhaD (predicted bifunctional aldolase and dehydrogenase)/NAD(P)-dependent dehydrogenase (short-subunit alcohol dehydrogenase family)
MQYRWSAKNAKEFGASAQDGLRQDVALLVYASRLLGAEPGLVLHGGGNASCKGQSKDIFGEPQRVLYVKGSGRDMATIAREDFTALDLQALLRFRGLPHLPESEMANEMHKCMLDCSAPCPSIETLAHAFLPAKYVLHTHADAILVLSNQRDGAEALRATLGPHVAIVPYYRPGFNLAKAAAAAFEAEPDAHGMIWINHGIVTWGEHAEEAYARMIELVSLAEEYSAHHSVASVQVPVAAAAVELAQERVAKLAPIVRGMLVRECTEQGEARAGAVVLPLVSPEVLAILGADGAKNLLVSAPLTSDHLIRTKPLPLWMGNVQHEDADGMAEEIRKAIECYAAGYKAYFERHADGSTVPYDSLPRVMLVPGAGLLAAGCDMESAVIARDIGLQSLLAKSRIAAMGGQYQTPPEKDLFHMEYDPFQRAKLKRKCKQALTGRTALVTGAAGAIGSGICEELLRRGCAVALADLPGERLTSQVEELRAAYGERVLETPFDVTEPKQVGSAFAAIARTWGGLDLVVINAGLAHVAPLSELDLESFRRLERVNVDGTLNLLSESARHFRIQNCGGDVVLISTKNVFAPGASFGAYSATKAAAHQLARIASLEMAGIGVRVNMVAPDAVFGHGSHRSGLWATVGPDRMRSRGLDEAGLEEYYQSRNLLKARVTATHVANAVIYFATRQSPTTGATIPVDGGLPDATPR